MGGKMGIKERVKRLISLQREGNYPGSLSNYEVTCLEFYRLLKKTNEKADFMWEDGWLKKNFEIIKKYAQSKEPLLLVGKTGTGKEVISRFIHFLSKRREKPFYPINCSSFSSEDLIQSELFGHEKGAFTGADRRMLFLDRLSIELSNGKSLSKKPHETEKENIKRGLKDYKKSISFPYALMREENENKFSKGGLYKIFQMMVEGGKSFWEVVYRPYLRRELNKAQLMELICFGLEFSGGSWKTLLPYFHIEEKDHKKFLNFLHAQGVKLNELKKF